MSKRFYHRIAALVVIFVVYFAACPLVFRIEKEINKRMGYHRRLPNSYIYRPYVYTLMSSGVHSQLLTSYCYQCGVGQQFKFKAICLDTGLDPTEFPDDCGSFSITD